MAKLLNQRNRFARKLEAVRVKGLGDKRVLTYEKQLSHACFGRRYVGWTYVRRHEHFEILLLRVGIEGADVDSGVFEAVRATKINEMASVGKERRLTMPGFFARKIQSRNRRRG